MAALDEITLFCGFCAVAEHRGWFRLLYRLGSGYGCSQDILSMRMSDAMSEIHR